jgi:DNA-binding SARP family transcriptional activator
MTKDGLAGKVLDRLPYGVVVVNGRGSVVEANGAAAEMLPQLDGQDGELRCHDLFDCQRQGGPCEAGCLAARAGSGAESLPEIRIDTTGERAVTALWVTASPLDHEDQAVLHLRPGDARDRRRRSEPHWIRGPELRITSFGRTHVDSGEGPLGGLWIQHRPGQLLKYLVCERNRVVHAEEIAEAIWPGSGPQALGRVRHFVHALRARLEPGRPRRAQSAFVVSVQGGYAVDRRRVRIDADDFEQAADAGLAAAEDGDARTARTELERAVELYRGEFLADEPYAEWAYAERNRLRALAATSLRALGELEAAEGNLPAAAAHLERLAELEPFDSDLHRKLLEVWLAQGRRTEAARRFAAFRVRMQREFGEEPEFTLAELRRPQPVTA